MNIDLLAKMVGELILDRDEVCLPGVGTFVAETVPAYFSDKGFTINPPYRRLSFRQRGAEDGALLDYYAASATSGAVAARVELTDFLLELKEILKDRKSVDLPGLGRLRATRENHFFFVPDEGLDIWPDGFALESISLKFHREPEPMQTVAAESAVSEETIPEAAPLPPEEIPTAGQTDAVPEAPAVPRGRAWRTVGRIFAGVLLAVALVLLLTVVLGRLAPSVVDPLLYDSAQLEILRHP